MQDVRRDMAAAARVRRIGSHVFVGGVLPVDAAGSLVGPDDIEAQTHAVFQSLRRALGAAGSRMADLVRLNTYYVYDGDDDVAAAYWERMTRVRLLYFPDPGPGATAVRVRGMGAAGALIQLEAEAVDRTGAERLRIMPEESWDWRIRVPLSQGWRIGDQVWVGGQISADKTGSTVAAGDTKAQTRNVLRHISNVLQGAGAGWKDLVHLKICYMHDGRPAEAERRLRDIVTVATEICGSPLPPVTAVGVKLLYEGLVLEIDAMADVGARRYGQIGGQGVSVPPAGLKQGTAAALGQVLHRLAEAGAGDLAHLHVFVAAAEADEDPDAALQQVADAVDAACPSAPSFTMVRVNGLPDDAVVQVSATTLRS
jgi:enamine deaminase RidA (YjgF/YER057c/UK114 family)